MQTEKSRITTGERSSGTAIDFFPHSLNDTDGGLLFMAGFSRKGNQYTSGRQRYIPISGNIIALTE